jgi:hypothetical protein
MQTPLFVRPLTADERATLETGLRSPSAFTVRRCQRLLARAEGQSPTTMAHALRCTDQTVRNALHAFHQRGLTVLQPLSSRPPPLHDLRRWGLRVSPGVVTSESADVRQAYQRVDPPASRRGQWRRGPDAALSQRRNHAPRLASVAGVLEAGQALDHQPRSSLGSKKLGWQTEREEVCLQFGERGRGIRAKTTPERALLPPRVEVLAACVPLIERRRSECLGGEGASPGRSGCDPRDGATANQSGGGHFAACRAPLMRAMRAEKLLQLIIGAWPSGHALTRQETRPVAWRDLMALSPGRGERARLGPGVGHGAEQAAQALLHRCLIVLGCVGQHGVGPRPPAIAPAESGPYVSGGSPPPG